MKITSTLATALQDHACRATHTAYRQASHEIINRPVKPPQHETWHVANLCASISDIAADWRKELSAALPGSTLSMASVFTHQKPYVKWPNRASKDPKCELADLLVVVIDRTGQSQNLAILLQAKIAGQGIANLKIAGEKKQFDLLSKRPVFDIVKADGPTQVDLRGYTPDSALLYGLASEFAIHHPFPPSRRCGWKTWFTADDLGRSTTGYKVMASDTLASVLVGLLQGNYGWSFDLAPVGENWAYFASANQRNDWSMLINYLLEDTFSQPMRSGLNVPAGRSTRGGEDKMFFTSQTAGNAPMFCILDGLNLSTIKNHFAASEGDSGKWVSSTLQDFMNDGGAGDRGDNFRPDDPEGGPISAIIIEVGRQG